MAQLRDGYNNFVDKAQNNAVKYISTIVLSLFGIAGVICLGLCFILLLRFGIAKVNNWPNVAFTVTSVDITKQDSFRQSDNWYKNSISYTITEEYEVDGQIYTTTTDKSDSMKSRNLGDTIEPYESVGDVSYYYVNPDDPTDFVHIELAGIIVFAFIGIVLLVVSGIGFIIKICLKKKTR